MTRADWALFWTYAVCTIVWGALCWGNYSAPFFLSRRTAARCLLTLPLWPLALPAMLFWHLPKWTAALWGAAEVPPLIDALRVIRGGYDTGGRVVGAEAGRLSHATGGELSRDRERVPSAQADARLRRKRRREQ